LLIDQLDRSTESYTNRPGNKKKSQICEKITNFFLRKYDSATTAARTFKKSGRNTSKKMKSSFTRLFSTEASAGTLKNTPLFSRHVDLKGKIVPFAGYSLPVLYEGKGIIKEHLHCRSQASVFDVSHMGQVRIKGKDRISFMERLICADVAGLKSGEASLTLFTNENGGVIDDAIICNAGSYLVRI
jgi:hypothetical protein